MRLCARVYSKLNNNVTMCDYKNYKSFPVSRLSMIEEHPMDVPFFIRRARGGLYTHDAIFIARGSQNSPLDCSASRALYVKDLLF